MRVLDVCVPFSHYNTMHKHAHKHTAQTHTRPARLRDFVVYDCWVIPTII